MNSLNKDFKTKKVIKYLFLIIFVYVIYIFIKNISNSLFFSSKDRINIIFYGDKTIFISLGLIDNVNYLGELDNNTEVLIPGGYSYYKIGSIGKLSEIEKKPEIIRKAFSSMHSLYIDYYFYPKNTSVYNSKNIEDFSQLSLNKYLFTDLISDINFFDRVYLFFKISNMKVKDFSIIDYATFTDQNNKFDHEKFSKKYLGYFFEKEYRNERKNVQIIYKDNLKTALTLSRILEGQGIRVVDLSNEKNTNKQCLIQKKTMMGKNKSVDFIFDLLKCNIKEEVIDTYDIKLFLSEKEEKEWLIN